MASERLPLSKCKREDLIWVINRLLQRVDSKNERYYLERALNDLWYEKEQKRFAEADKVSKLADEKTREYIELVEQYNGVPIMDIPVEVLKKMQDLLEESNRLNRRFAHMMGVKEGE